MVSRFSDIGADQMSAQVFSAVVIEIHGQEGDVRSYIRIPKPFIKLDAIDNENLISPGDMLQPKVPVAVQNPTGRDPLQKYFPIRSKKRVRLILYLFIQFPAHGHINISLCLLEVLVGILLYAFRFRKTVN